MTIPRLDPAALRTLAESHGLQLDDEELSQLHDTVNGLLGGLDAIELLPEPPREPVPVREHHRADAGDNPYNAWVWRTSVREREDGPLAGRQVVLKDNIALAGVPMGGGSDFLEHFVPEEDATIVRRILEAGGEIVGKAACEYLSMSAGSHTSATGPVRNPRNPEHTTGGSSSGCAALVSSGEVAFAIGGDQGGSIRLPASFTGIVGLKPTHGLVPYTGLLSLDAHIDHTGPMTASVADNALLLQVIAGSDGRDPRQAHARTADYTGAAAASARGLRVGVVEEGFGTSTEPGVADAVRACAEGLVGQGVELKSCSVPEHLTIGIAALPFLVQGAYELMRGNGFAMHSGQPVLYGLPEAFSRWRAPETQLPFVQTAMILAGAVAQSSGPALYAKGLRLRAAARAAYDRAFESFDALLMPTTPCTAPRLPAADASSAELLGAGSAGITNTSQFDVSGHPAISVPCGESGGLPVGCMLVGRHCDEATLYRLAAAVEAG